MITTNASGEPVVSLAPDVEQGYREAEGADRADDEDEAGPFAPMVVLVLAALVACGLAALAAALLLSLARGAA